MFNVELRINKNDFVGFGSDSELNRPVQNSGALCAVRFIFGYKKQF